MSYKYVKNLGRNSSSRSSYGYGSGIDGITVHHWGSTGQKHANVVSWLRGYTGNRGSSAHYVVSDGLVTQLVDDSRASWHGGNNKANGTTIGIEMRPEMTDGDWETLVELCVNIERKHGSMKYYKHKDWKNTACPGKYSSRIGELVKAVNAYKKTGKVPSTTGGGSSSGGSSYGNPNAKHEVGSRIMRKGSAGTDVQWLQKRLYKLGYTITPKKNGTFDGMFGPEVDKAVRALQRAAKIAVDGDAGKDTVAAAKGAKVKRNLPSKPKHKKSKAPKFPLPKGHWYGPESRNKKNHSGYWAKDRAGIKQFQNKLKSRGWTIDADGRFGRATKKVVRQFQAEKKIRVDGGVGAVTWAKIWEAPVT